MNWWKLRNIKTYKKPIDGFDYGKNGYDSNKSNVGFNERTGEFQIEIKDRFGKPITPREWFLVPLFIIDAVVEKIKDKTLMNYRYCSDTVSLIEM